MSSATERGKVCVPRINANDAEAQVADVKRKNGEKVSRGDVICVLETTKATIEIECEAEGYITELAIHSGQLVSVGDLICRIGSDPPLEVASPVLLGKPVHNTGNTNPELRITRPARQLAEKLGLDLASLPMDRVVTEAVVREIALAPASVKDKSRPVQTTSFRGNSLVVFGAGGHAKKVLDLLRGLPGFRVVGLVDDSRPKGETTLGYNIIGGRDVLKSVFDAGTRLAVNGVGAIAKPASRSSIFDLLSDAGFAFPALIHSYAFVELSAKVEEGAQIFATAFVESDAYIGFGAIVNSGAIISHDCRIASFSHVAPGAVLAGHVDVGSNVLIGMGVTVDIGVRLGESSRIGNAARIHADVPAGTIVPSGTSWPG